MISEDNLENTMSDQSADSSVWCDKHRPETLAEIVGNDAIINKFSDFAQTADFPNMLLSGPPGVGKTMSAKLLVKELYDDTAGMHLLSIDSWANRHRLRDEIQEFMRSDNQHQTPQVLIIERGDMLFDQAQHGLQHLVKQYSHNTRVILTARHSSKVQESLQSLCVMFRFSPIEASAFADHIRGITDREELEITDEAIEHLHQVTDGDLRQGTNFLQAASMGESAHIDESDIRALSPTVPDQSVTQMITEATAGNYDDAQTILDSILADGISGITIIDQLDQQIRDTEISGRPKVKILNQIGDIRYRLESGGDPTVQLSSLLAEMVLMSQAD